MGEGIVFVPQIGSSRTSDLTYTVTITDVAGLPNPTITYNVTIVSINTAPTISHSVTGHRCSGKDLVIYPSYADSEDDAVSLSLAKGAGDADQFTLKEYKFSGGKKYELLPKTSLDPSRSTYSFTITATDALGAAREQNLTATIPDPPSRTICGVRKVLLKRTKSGVSIQWSVPAVGAKATKYVVRVGNRTCTTKKSSCSIKGLRKGRYSVYVSSYRSGSRTVTTTTKLSVR